MVTDVTNPRMLNHEMVYYIYFTCLLVICILIALVIRTNTNYRDYYFCSHTVGGYALLFFAGYTQQYSEKYYVDDISSVSSPHFGILFFCTSHIAFSMVYAVFYPNFIHGDNRRKKRIIFMMLLTALILTYKRHSYFLLLMVASIAVGILFGLCNIYLVRNKELFTRWYRNMMLPDVDRGIQYEPLPVDYGIQDLDTKATEDGPDADDDGEDETI